MIKTYRIALIIIGILSIIFSALACSSDNTESELRNIEHRLNEACDTLEEARVYCEDYSNELAISRINDAFDDIDYARSAVSDILYRLYEEPNRDYEEGY